MSDSISIDSYPSATKLVLGPSDLQSAGLNPTNSPPLTNILADELSFKLRV
jgi:hypothetical protein